MNGLIRQGSRYSEQTQGLRRALDRSYAQFRERARAEWERRNPNGDPSDACVQVRIEDPRLPKLAL